MVTRDPAVRMVFAFALVGVGACAQATRRSAALEGPGVMDRCQPTEVLIVENKTSYPVRVIATDGGYQTFNANQVVEVVPSGGVDTIPRAVIGQPKVALDLEAPRMASGVQAPTTGLRAECVTAK